MVREAAARKVMALLGQGRRMGSIASGQEAVADRVGRRAAALLLFALDAPEAAEALAAAASAAGIPVARALTREDLGTALGASPRWAAAIEDPPLAAGILEYLAMAEAMAGAAPGAGPSRDEPVVRAGGQQGGRD
jgi:ribosomal protein L7Ae-like RNA K-turn-binding protein